MKESEWLRITEGIRARWPHAELPHSSIEVWFDAVRDLDADQVEVAVEVVYRDGREFPPNGAQLRAKVTELGMDAPPWHEVLKLIRRALRKPHNLIVDDDSEKGWHYSDERLVYLDEHSPIVAAFVRRVGFDQLTETAENGEARLREKWRDFELRERQNRNYAGLPSAGLKRLEGPHKMQFGKVAEVLALPTKTTTTERKSA